MLHDHEIRIESLLDLIAEKVDKTIVESMISDKVAKSDVKDLLPDMDAHEQKINSKIEQSVDDLQKKLKEKLITWDQRMISIRNEFDLVSINKFIDTKANKETVASDF